MGDVHIPMPIDKKRMQEKKIEKLQQQIFNAEQQMIERSALINRLDYLNDLEKQRTNRIMDRLGRTNFTINEEIERLYGDQARSYSVSPVQRGVVEDIISHRTKEFSVAQQEKAMQIKYLHLERKRLQDARERLREKRHNLMYAPSPVGKETYKTWGQKYQIYTPLEYDYMFDIYSPRYNEATYPFLPEVTWATGKKYHYRPRKVFKRKYLYVAQPLYTSSLLW